MKIIRGIHNIKAINSYSVVTIGNFDGIHLGHQKLFSKTYEIGKTYKIQSIIILFEPQPLEFLQKKYAPARLTTFRYKIKHISYYKVDTVLCIKFNQSFLSLSAEDFIINILINKLHMKFIIIGDNFRFGFQRNGDIDLLRKIGKKKQFNVIEIPSIYQNNIKVSSTNIRQALSKNNIKLASILLGRQFSIYGKVIHGCRIGRKIGYPTANILLNQNFSLQNGVYAVKINYNIHKKLLGISNIGTKPSFTKNKNKLLEVYLFDLEINLYHKEIEVLIYKKIRDEKVFISITDLKNQISKDIKSVKKYFQID